MDGFKAFKYYTSIKLHFTTKKFDVFKNKGHLKGTYEKFIQRNDKNLFEKAANLFPNDRDFILFVASNCMYGNIGCIYSSTLANVLYKTYIKRRQSITYVFETDLRYLEDNNCLDDKKIIFSYINNEITLETVVILNSLRGIVNTLEKEKATLPLLLDRELTIIKKADKFVKYDKNKIQKIYNRYFEEVKNG